MSEELDKYLKCRFFSNLGKFVFFLFDTRGIPKQLTEEWVDKKLKTDNLNFVYFILNLNQIKKYKGLFKNS